MRQVKKLLEVALRVGYYQFRPLFGQVGKNLEKVLRALSTVSADLIVLPELAFTGYHFASRAELVELAEEVRKSSTVAALVSLCTDRQLHIVTGFAEREGQSVYNSALLLGPSGVMHTYRKLHLFNNEKNCFDPGDLPLAVQSVSGVPVGMMVCFDWAFPEVARTLALRGAAVLCHPSNLVLGYCQQAMLTRCLENRVFAVTANRFGPDKRPHGSLRFTGRSQVVAPSGAVLHQAPSQRDELYVVDIDPSIARNKQITELNDLIADRRPAFYA